MFPINPLATTVFGLVSSNQSLISDYTSTTSAAYIKVTADGRRQAEGFVYGVSNYGDSIPSFVIGQYGTDKVAEDIVVHNHKVGINKGTPAYDLDVYGHINYSGDFYRGTVKTAQWDAVGTTGMNVDKDVNIQRTLRVDGTLYASNLNVLGTTTIINSATTETSNFLINYPVGPGYALEVIGDSKFRSNVYFENSHSIKDYSLTADVNSSISTALTTAQGYATTAETNANSYTDTHILTAQNVGTTSGHNLNLSAVNKTTNVLGSMSVANLLSTSNLTVTSNLNTFNANIYGTTQTNNMIVDGTLYASGDLSVAGTLHAEKFRLGTHLTPAYIMGPLTTYNDITVTGSLNVASNINADSLTIGGFRFELGAPNELNIVQASTGNLIVTLTQTTP